jgi:hypothetical protein
MTGKPVAILHVPSSGRWSGLLRAPLRSGPKPSRLYEELRRQLEDWRDVRVILDRGEGERRTPRDTFSGVDRRRVERRHRLNGEPYLKLGGSGVDKDELVS